MSGMRIFLIINEGADCSAPSRLSIKVQTVKNSNALSLCHSEERSDEESFCYRYCEDPSLSLRMTWQETGFRHRHIYALLASKPKGLLRKHFDLPRNSHSLAYRGTVELRSKSKYLRSKPFGLDARRAYMSMPKPGFFLCHPERKRRILARSTAKKILRHFVPQNDKGREHYDILTVWSFFDSLIGGLQMQSS